MRRDDAGVGTVQWPDGEPHHLACRARVRDLELIAGLPAAKRLVRTFVDQVDLRTGRQAAEINDDVGTFRRGDEELVQLDRPG